MVIRPMYIISGGEDMSLGLATKGVLPDFTGTGSGSVVVPEYVSALIDVEVETDIVEVIAETISDTVSITNSGVITIEVELPEDDQITAEELSVDIIIESNEISVEVNPCQA